MINCFSPVWSGQNIIGSVQDQAHTIYFFVVQSRSVQEVTGHYGVRVPKTLPCRTLVWMRIYLSSDKTSSISEKLTIATFSTPILSKTSCAYPVFSSTTYLSLILGCLRMLWRWHKPIRPTPNKAKSSLVLLMKLFIEDIVLVMSDRWTVMKRTNQKLKNVKYGYQYMKFCK